MTADQVSVPKSDGWDVPLEIGAVIVVSYLALRLVWQQFVFSPYSFAIERAFFLVVVCTYVGIRYRWPPTVLLGSFRFPDRSHWTFFAAIFGIAMVLRLLVKMAAGHVDHYDFSLRLFIDNCIIPPINEEPLFRGVVISSLIGAFPHRKWGVVLLSAVIFTAAHRLFSIAALALMAGGLCYGALFLRTRSITACILLHSLWNGMVFIDLPNALKIYD